MLTNVQKETLQTLINLYQSSNGKSIKGVTIASAMNRNPGTVRNQMISLRRLGLVNGIPGPCGGYKPTIEAYHSLNISVSDNDSNVPIYKNGKKMEEISVAKIEFINVPQPGECEAAIKVLGSIKDWNFGDNIIIGPTPVNNLRIMGKIVGINDIDNILLVNTNTIQSIPKKTIGEIARRDVVSIKEGCSIKEAVNKLVANEIDGIPVMKDQKVVGVFTVTELLQAIANNNENQTVGDLMSTDVVIVNKDLKITNAIELIFGSIQKVLIVMDDDHSLFGILTIKDLIETMIDSN